jgi:hypothetical protein
MSLLVGAQAASTLPRLKTNNAGRVADCLGSGARQPNNAGLASRLGDKPGYPVRRWVPRSVATPMADSWAGSLSRWPMSSSLWSSRRPDSVPSTSVEGRERDGPPRIDPRSGIGGGHRSLASLPGGGAREASRDHCASGLPPRTFPSTTTVSTGLSPSWWSTS